MVDRDAPQPLAPSGPGREQAGGATQTERVESRASTEPRRGFQVTHQLGGASSKGEHVGLSLRRCDDRSSM
jgi:hypothetical protein